MDTPVPSESPRLHGVRVTLRAIRPSDFDAFYSVYSDPRVTRYWSFPAWTHPSQGEAYFASAVEGSDPSRLLCWAVTLDDDRLIGTTTLFAINRAQGRAEIGYALHPDAWGRGLAGDALGAMVGHAFDGLGLRRLEADIDPRNTASCRLVERLGFVREGLLRERWHVAGETCDSALFGLLAREWRAPHAMS